MIRAGNVTWNQINQIHVDKTYLLKLYNNYLANELYKLFYDIRRMNDDAETANRGYVVLRDAFIQQHIDQPDYIQNAKILAEQLAPLKVFLKKPKKMGCGYSLKLEFNTKR